jgi:hypothetical protein
LFLKLQILPDILRRFCPEIPRSNVLNITLSFDFFPSEVEIVENETSIWNAYGHRMPGATPTDYGGIRKFATGDS